MRTCYAQIGGGLLEKLHLTMGFMLSLHLLSFECTQEVGKHKRKVQESHEAIAEFDASFSYYY